MEAFKRVSRPGIPLNLSSAFACVLDLRGFVRKAACKAVMASIGIIIINRGIQQGKGVGLQP